jgi:hypothetical protein
VAADNFTGVILDGNQLSAAFWAIDISVKLLISFFAA